MLPEGTAVAQDLQGLLSARTRPLHGATAATWGAMVCSCVCQLCAGPQQCGMKIKSLGSLLFEFCAALPLLRVTQLTVSTPWHVR